MLPKCSVEYDCMILFLQIKSTEPSARTGTGRVKGLVQGQVLRPGPGQVLRPGPGQVRGQIQRRVQGQVQGQVQGRVQGQV